MTSETGTGGADVRMATAADAALLGRLLEDFNAEFDTKTESAEILGDRFARIMAEDTVLVLVADDGAGFALLTLRPAIWFDGPVAVLDELYVVPDRRGHGIGTAMIAAARAVLRERGCPEIHINVDEVDADARRFYERHGFVNLEPGTDLRMLCYIGPT